MRIDFPKVFPVFTVFAVLVLTGCFSSKKTQTTGWSYEADSAGFEYVEFQKQPEIPRNAKRYFEDMKLIEGGTFSMGRIDIFDPPGERDSLLLAQNYPRRVTVTSFYLSDHEVTNAEYREFTDWVMDSVALSILAEKNPSFYKNPKVKLLNWDMRQALKSGKYSAGLKKIMKEDTLFHHTVYDTKNCIYTFHARDTSISIHVYPDTTCWMIDFTYSFNQPMERMYNWHPAYNNYPVTGVSWLQANAYCRWRSDRLNEEIIKSYTKKDKNVGVPIYAHYPNFRLPTEAEWEYACLNLTPEDRAKEKDYYHPVLPWTDKNLTDSKGQYRANFGPIRDANWFEAKHYTEGIFDKKTKTENYFYTSPVKSFQPNSMNLYDMAGNVAEWVLDIALAKSHIDYDEFGPYRCRVDRWDTSSIDPSIKFTPEQLGIVPPTDSALHCHYRYLDSLYYTYKIHATDNLQSAMTKIVNTNHRQLYPMIRDTITARDKMRIRNQALIELHDARLIAKYPNARIIKGGSWVDSIFYLQGACRQLYPETKGSSRIGFRIAMTRVGIPIIKKEIKDKK